MSDTSLLPDGGGPEDTADGVEGFDVSDLRVNFSEKEADSKAIDFEPIPTGKYQVCITEWEVKRSTSEKNNRKNYGKPYWALTLTIQNGPYENRKLWWNVMLFDGALYSLTQLMESLGYSVAAGEFKVPNADELVGRDFIVNVSKLVDKYKIEQGEWDGKGPKPMKNEVKGAKALGDGSEATAGSGSSSLMP
jgi:hypothetical protein